MLGKPYTSVSEMLSEIKDITEETKNIKKENKNKVPSEVFKNESDVEEFFKELIDNNWSVTKTLDRYGLKRSSFYKLVGNKHYKKILQTAVTAAKLIFLADFLEGATHPDLNIRIKYINKAPEILLKELLDLENTDTEDNNSNTIML